MKTRSALLPFAFVFLFISCKKDHTSNAPPQLVKVKTVFAGNDLRTYSYDCKGRVTQIDLVLYGKQLFAYTDTGIVVSNYDTTGGFTGKQVYKLGANGLVASSYGSYSPYDLTLCSYTAAGQLLKSSLTRTIPGQALRRWDNTYFYSNNNLDSVLSSYTQGSTVTNSVSAYYDAYYTDKTNTLGNDNFGQAYLGVGSKNPVKAARDIGSDSQGNMPQTNYTYEYDAQHNIIKVLHTWGTSSFTPLSYTYY